MYAIAAVVLGGISMSGGKGIILILVIFVQVAGPKIKDKLKRNTE